MGMNCRRISSDFGMRNANNSGSGKGHDAELTPLVG
jgi:hypothetical protein